jgi:hypothetical protein
MNDPLQDNFAIAAKLERTAAAKIQAVLRCLADNTITKIALKDPAVGGKTVHFDLISGQLLDLDDCCDLRDVSRTGDRLDA